MSDDITQTLRAAVPKMPDSGTPIAWPCKVRSELLLEAAAEIEKMRAERDTLLLDAREFVRWFSRHYPDPSRDPGHPWCAINNRLNAHADTLETLDAAMGLWDALDHAAEQASKP